MKRKKEEKKIIFLSCISFLENDSLYILTSRGSIDNEMKPISEPSKMTIGTIILATVAFSILLVILFTYRVEKRIRFTNHLSQYVWIGEFKFTFSESLFFTVFIFVYFVGVLYQNIPTTHIKGHMKRYSGHIEFYAGMSS